MLLPLSFRRAPPHTLALFLACLWHEANRAEASHLAHTVTAGGERLTGRAGGQRVGGRE
jgi:hypothetical protein